jgi:hypothetical protein
MAPKAGRGKGRGGGGKGDRKKKEEKGTACTDETPMLFMRVQSPVNICRARLLRSRARARRY